MTLKETEKISEFYKDFYNLLRNKKKLDYDEKSLEAMNSTIPVFIAAMAFITPSVKEIPILQDFFYQILFYTLIMIIFLVIFLSESRIALKETRTNVRKDKINKAFIVLRIMITIVFLSFFVLYLCPFFIKIDISNILILTSIPIFYFLMSLYFNMRCRIYGSKNQY